VTETLTLEEREVQERFFAEGWTDGLPIVPPTPQRVAAMLESGAIGADEVLGAVPGRDRTINAQNVAINAVMAGCKPEYFPVVVAAVSAMLDPNFNVNTVVTSTGGAALCLVVSGPIAAAIGMNARHNALGSGNRANATIGRAVRLLAGNVLDARTGGLDGTSLGHPGKYSLCFAEDPPPAPWLPLAERLGYAPGTTTVTVLGTEGPRQVANNLNPSGQGILRTFAAAMRNPATFTVGKGGQVIIVSGPEHTSALLEEGWSQDAVLQFLVRESRVAPAELEAAGVIIERNGQHDMTPGADGKLPSVESAADIFLVTAGGAGAGWSAYVPCWAPKLHTRATTRVVRPAGPATSA
jgi:hypothetical protein